MNFGMKAQRTLYDDKQGSMVQLLTRTQTHPVGIIRKVDEAGLYLNPHLSSHPSGFGNLENDSDLIMDLNEILAPRFLTNNEYESLSSPHPVLDHIGKYVAVMNGSTQRQGKLQDIVRGYAVLNPVIGRMGDKVVEQDMLVHLPLSNAEIASLTEKDYRSILNNS